MNIFIFCAFALLATSQAQDFVLLRHGLPPPPPPKARAATPVWGNITQKLDNFNINDKRTWSMRYLSNAQFYKPGGPIFIMLGAEWTIDPGWLQTGQMYDMAQEHNGYMFYTEHRYYGNSKPTYDLSTANLAYLTTPQALEDAAVFLRDRKAKIAGLANAKVIVVGGSYGGNMAIWLREKYPTLVHAALSSSAPVRASVDFKEYFEKVGAGLNDTNCYGVISSGIAFANYSLSIGAAGVSKVQKDFNLCKPVNVNDFYDKAYFFNSLANTFAGLIQYASGTQVKDTCNELMNPPNLDAYTRFSKYILKRRTGCVSDYSNFVRYFAQTNLIGDSRQWLFQTCNEYGYFQTSASPNQPFGNSFPVAMNYKMCQDIYGAAYDGNRVNAAAAATNARYGGLNPNVTRVVSVHGTVDPWSALGLTRDVNTLTPVIVVQGTSHCADLSSVSASDSADMKDAKNRVKSMIRQWLPMN